MPGLNAEDLLKKLENGTLTEEERALLETWYLYEARKRTQPVRKKYWWYSSAAAILVIALITFWTKKEKVQKEIVQDILPGDYRAQLILGNSKQIDLENAPNGVLVEDEGALIMKVNGGELVYKRKSNSKAKHKLITPKAGQYQLTLADGTKVWLNAASSIEFSSDFEERVVQASGEVYFEVAHLERNGKRVPFRVITDTQVVEVLGTRFNINSYSDEEAIETTLLEGSIQISSSGEKTILKPGHQAKVQKGKPLRISKIDAHQVVAWKDGIIRFEGIGINELMRQLSRWYDIEVVYEGTVKEYEFVGEISRDTKLSSVLKILEAGGVRFQVEGKKITVME
ncbi:anti-FecI sigma factor, FecR [Leadbetterella byssophila DSM 17132]|uniref:Anti-FecI sigma factor, FecR n=1 Tax=Leadbetterella byssophila (strain DSM 17132 / JCM 16389 / KACC 11308 / NBRC 106382 / 4M15) TaxID=649349 RepID=E4RYE3_LEAB4|nr:FecR family protein [Leadbetterella byssophila]ADQ18179.1 anti-FecI sigma factor, FecR [Leadbetterella byssophila DSM 17132]